MCTDLLFIHSSEMNDTDVDLVIVFNTLLLVSLMNMQALIMRYIALNILCE